MRIHCLSDTHNRHADFTLPGGELLIHAGDATGRGSIPEIMAFLSWFGQQPYEHKVFVPGNHDWGFVHDENLFREECKRLGIVLLINESVEINCVKIWGSPVTPRFFNWAFNVDRGTSIKAFWDQIPEDTEILITHGPPAKILDWVPRGGHVGCEDLFNRIVGTKVKLHVFGHIHPARGTMYFMDRLFVNASSVDDGHRPVGGVPRKVKLGDSGLYELDE